MKPIQRGQKWSVNYRNKEGKSCRESFKTLEEANLWVSVMTTKPIPKDETANSNIKEGLEGFMAFKLGNKRPATIKNIRSLLQLALPNIGLPKPTKHTIFAYCLARRYRSSTAKGIVKWVRSYLEFHKIPNDVEWEMLNEALTKEDKKPKPYLNHDEFDKLMGFCPLWYQTVFKYMSSNGIRVTELSRLEQCDINWATWEVTLPAQKSKAKRERTNIIPEELRSDFVKCFPPMSKGFLIHRGHGEQISSVGLGNIFRSYCDKAGLGKRNIHLLRAYAILKLLESSGNNYEAVRKICGWDSEEMQKYIGKMSKEKQEIAVNMTWDNKAIDSSREYDILVDKLHLVMDGRVGSLQELSARSKVSYEWIHQALVAKRNKDLENLMTIMKCLQHYPALQAYAGKKAAG